MDTNSLCVEEVECFFDFLFLFLGKFVPGLSGGFEGSFFLFESGHEYEFKKIITVSSMS